MALSLDRTKWLELAQAIRNKLLEQGHGMAQGWRNEDR